jgi:hypothetical protein
MVNAYDGTYGKSSATQKTPHEHIAQFAFIGAVTPLGAERFEKFLSEIGPRLLMHRIPEMTEEERAASLRALRDRLARAAIRERLTTAIKTHLTALAAPEITTPEVSEETFERIEYLSAVVARGRGTFDEESARTQIENTSRVFQVLVSFGQAVALVRGHAGVTEDDIDVLKSVTLGSIPLGRANVLQRLATSANGRTVQDIAGSEEWAATSRVRRSLDDLQRLGLVERIGSVGKGGADVYQPVPVVRLALNGAGGHDLFSEALTPGISETSKHS